jgi:hypothetical protein
MSRMLSSRLISVMAAVASVKGTMAIPSALAAERLATVSSAKTHCARGRVRGESFPDAERRHFGVLVSSDNAAEIEDQAAIAHDQSLRGLMGAQLSRPAEKRGSTATCPSTR